MAVLLRCLLLLCCAVVLADGQGPFFLPNVPPDAVLLLNNRRGWPLPTPSTRGDTESDGGTQSTTSPSASASTLSQPRDAATSTKTFRDSAVSSSAQATGTAEYSHRVTIPLTPSSHASSPVEHSSPSPVAQSSTLLVARSSSAPLPSSIPEDHSSVANSMPAPQSTMQLSQTQLMSSRGTTELTGRREIPSTNVDLQATTAATSKVASGYQTGTESALLHTSMSSTTGAVTAEPAGADNCSFSNHSTTNCTAKHH